MSDWTIVASVIGFGFSLPAGFLLLVRIRDTYVSRRPKPLKAAPIYHGRVLPHPADDKWTIGYGGVFQYESLAVFPHVVKVHDVAIMSDEREAMRYYKAIELAWKHRQLEAALEKLP